MSLNLRAKKRSDITAEIQFPAPFKPLEIEVRHVTRLRNDELLKAATVRGRVDAGKYSRLYALECFVAGRGLKPDVLRRFVELEDDSPAPATDGNGDIPLDVDMFVFLWQNARNEDFADVIFAESESLLREHDAAKNA